MGAAFNTIPTQRQQLALAMPGDIAVCVDRRVSRQGTDGVAGVGDVSQDQLAGAFTVTAPDGIDDLLVF